MPNPRILVICVFRNGSRILAAQGFDKHKAEHFFRPIGGAVEFGETTTDAIRREVREELGVEIEGVKRLGVLENLFCYNGEPSHEIVFVLDASFVDETLYDATELPIYEDVWVGPARWLDLDSLPEAPLYPDGILELLTRQNKSMHRSG